MIVRNWHIGKVASLRDAHEVLIVSHRTVLCLYGVVKIKPLRGFFMANVDNHIFIFNETYYFKRNVFCIF